MIDSGDPTLNEILKRFQTTLQTIKPYIRPNLLHIACYDYLKIMKY